MILGLGNRGSSAQQQSRGNYIGSDATVGSSKRKHYLVVVASLLLVHAGPAAESISPARHRNLDAPAEETSSTQNAAKARPTRPAEVLVSGDAFRVVREREKVADLWRGETL